jgi:hypothetical protein
MATQQILADDEVQEIRLGVVAAELAEFWIDASLVAGEIAIAAVHNRLLVISEHDRLDQSVLLDIGNKVVEFLAFHQREQIGDRMDLVLAIDAHLERGRRSIVIEESLTTV